MSESVTQLLDDLLATAQLWLGPTVEAECRASDAAKLRTFVVNLRDARDRVAVMEGCTDAPQSGLAASLEGLAATISRWLDGTTLYRRSIGDLMATCTMLSSQAAALELALRRLSGTEDDADLETLALAVILHRGGVRPATALLRSALPAPGGDAA